MVEQALERSLHPDVFTRTKIIQLAKARSAKQARRFQRSVSEPRFKSQSRISYCETPRVSRRVGRAAR